MRAQSAGNESSNEMEYTCSSVHRSGEHPGQVVPKPPAGLSVSPISRSETNPDVNVEESDPVRADEFGPTSADEDVVQEAEELEHVPAPILPSKAEVESHNVAHLPFRSWCSARVRCRGLSLGYRKVDTKTKEAELIPTVSVDHGFFGQPEDRAHDTLPVLIVRNRKSTGIWSHPVPSKGVTHPYPASALMADLDLSSSHIRSPALLPSMTLSRIVGTARVCLKHLPRARARATERSNVLSNLCTDLRGPHRLPGATIWNHVGWLGWSSEHCSNLLELFHG